MNWRKLKQLTHQLLKQSLQTTHSRMVTLGVCIGCCYLPTWLGILWSTTLHGSSNVILNGAFIYLSLEMLWKQRQALAQLSVYDDDRFLGHTLILGGALSFPFCFASASLQALIWSLILIGIAFSTWGLAGCKRSGVASLLLIAGMYPDLGFLAAQIWHLLTFDQMLESGMAWVGGMALRALGQPASSQNSYIYFPTGGVEVASGCSGFDMAFTLAGVGLILGLFFKQSRLKILSLMGIGILLALVFNVPRIMLVTMAAVYWGKASFEFWHGSIGGQLFAGIMLTAYYYLAMGCLNRPAKQPELKG